MLSNGVLAVRLCRERSSSRRRRRTQGVERAMRVRRAERRVQGVVRAMGVESLFVCGRRMILLAFL